MNEGEINTQREKRERDIYIYEKKGMKRICVWFEREQALRSIPIVLMVLPLSRLLSIWNKVDSYVHVSIRSHLSLLLFVNISFIRFISFICISLSLCLLFETS